MLTHMHKLVIATVRGGIKKNCFFFTFSQKIQTPPSPPFLTASVFSDKDFFVFAETPPPLVKISQKSPSIF